MHLSHLKPVLVRNSTGNKKLFLASADQAKSYEVIPTEHRSRAASSRTALMDITTPASTSHDPFSAPPEDRPQEVFCVVLKTSTAIVRSSFVVGMPVVFTPFMDISDHIEKPDPVHWYGRLLSASITFA